MEAWVQIIPHIKHDRDKLNVLFTCKTLYTLLDTATFRGTYMWGLRYPFTDVTRNIKKFKHVYSRTDFYLDIPNAATYLVIQTNVHFEFMPEQITKLKIQGGACLTFTQWCHGKTSIKHLKLGEHDSEQSSLRYLFNISRDLRKVTLAKHCNIKSMRLITAKCVNIKTRTKTNAGVYYIVADNPEHMIISTPDAESIYLNPTKTLTFNCDIVPQHRHLDDPGWLFKYTGSAKVRFTKRFTMDFNRLYLPYVTHLSFSKHYTKPVMPSPHVVYLKYRGKIYNYNDIEKIKTFH
jgi:hypothetical protein